MNPEIIGKRVKIIMANKGIKRKYLAKKLKISYNTLTSKLNGKSEFSARQMSIIKETLELDNDFSINLFFNPDFEIKEDSNIC